MAGCKSYRQRFRVLVCVFKASLQRHKCQLALVERERELLKRVSESWKSPFTVVVIPSIKVRVSYLSLAIKGVLDLRNIALLCQAFV